MAALSSFGSTSLSDSYAPPPQILSGEVQVTSEPVTWTATAAPAIGTVEASLITTPPRIDIGATLLSTGPPVRTSTLLAAFAMLMLTAMTGAFVLAARS